MKEIILEGFLFTTFCVVKLLVMYWEDYYECYCKGKKWLAYVTSPDGERFRKTFSTKRRCYCYGRHKYDTL